MKKTAAGLIAVVLVFGLVACSSTNDRKTAMKNDQNASANALVQLQQAQPTPNFNYSQLRQNLIEIETAQANATQTTSFFFNLGVTDPIMSCPSIGYPIPASYQLTNPDQKVVDHDLTIAQSEVTGVYTGDTTGTHVVCIDGQGRGYDNYWEGFVSAVTGPAVWDSEAHQIRLTGAPTSEFTTEQK